MDAFMTPFLNELHTLCLESSSDVHGEVENALHQRLQSCGDKKKQALQLNAVAKGSSRYMGAVSSKFVRNFDKFDLYMRRNIVSVPVDLADEVEALYNAKIQSQQSSRSYTEQQGKGDDQTADFVDPSLSKEEQQEKQLEHELKDLRYQLQEIAARKRKLQLEHTALGKNAERFNGLTAEMEFLDRIPSQMVSGLKRAINHLPALHDSLKRVDAVQQTLEGETRAFKRAKTESRASFCTYSTIMGLQWLPIQSLPHSTRMLTPVSGSIVQNATVNLRERFVANSSAVSFASSNDLKALQLSLTTL